METTCSEQTIELIKWIGKIGGNFLRGQTCEGRSLGLNGTLYRLIGFCRAIVKIPSQQIVFVSHRHSSLTTLGGFW